MDADRGCYCCAEVLSKFPLRYRIVNQMVQLANDTEHRNLPVYVCPRCDGPLAETAANA